MSKIKELDNARWILYTINMKNFIDLKCGYNLYKSFYAVAKLGGFSAAAKYLFVSQPSISYNIKTLEKQLGTHLLYRDNKKITLTPEGKRLYSYIEAAHDLLICGEKSLLDSSSLVAGELSIGVPTQIANFYLVDLIKKFKSQYPNIMIKIFSRSTKEMISMLNDNIIDLIVDNLPIDNVDQKFVINSIKKVESCLAYSPNYKKKNKNELDLSEEILILPNQYTVTRKAINNYFKNKGVDNIRCEYEVSTTETTLNMVLKGMGIGYFFRPSIEEYIANGQLKIIEEYKDLPTIELGCAYNKKFLSTATKKFIELIDEGKWQN